MKFNPTNAAGSRVYDMDTGSLIGRVLEVDASKLEVTVDAGESAIEEMVLRFDKIEVAYKQDGRVHAFLCFKRNCGVSAKHLIKAELAALEASVRKAVNEFAKNTGLPVDIALSYEQVEPGTADGADLLVKSIEIETRRKVAVFDGAVQGPAGGAK